MVQQLLLVGRLESQPPRPTADVLAIAPRIQRAWDALAVSDRSLTLRDEAPDWLAVADGDQLDQVLWALLDNAVKYGAGHGRRRDRRRPRGPDDCGRRSPTRAAGSTKSDRAWLFGRFERGAAGRTSGNGSGLGLYVSRALMRGMGGDLVLDPVEPGRGATFRLTLPGRAARRGLSG